MDNTELPSTIFFMKNPTFQPLQKYFPKEIHPHDYINQLTLTIEEFVSAFDHVDRLLAVQMWRELESKNKFVPSSTTLESSTHAFTKLDVLNLREKVRTSENLTVAENATFNWDCKILDCSHSYLEDDSAEALVSFLMKFTKAQVIDFAFSQLTENAWPTLQKLLAKDNLSYLIVNGNHDLCGPKSIFHEVFKQFTPEQWSKLIWLSASSFPQDGWTDLMEGQISEECITTIYQTHRKFFNEYIFDFSEETCTSFIRQQRKSRVFEALLAGGAEWTRTDDSAEHS